MKHLFTWCICTLIVPAVLNGQAVSISETGALPNAKSILDVTSVTKGAILPRMNTVERIAIGAGVPETGMIVFDTDLSKYMQFTGLSWEVVGDGLWLSHTLGAHRSGNVGINTVPQSLSKLYVLTETNVIGAGRTGIYSFRSGSSTDSPAGTNFGNTGIDAAIKGYSFWGNQFSAGVAAYSFLDFNESTALVAGNVNASVRALLAFKDGNGRIWAGHLTGDARISGQLGVGTTPNTISILHAETADYDRTGYFNNTRNTSNTTFGIYGGAFGTGSGDKRGGSFDAVGGTGVNIGVRGHASGGATNWAGFFAGGNVHVTNNLLIKTQTLATGYSLCVNGRIIGEELRIQDMVNWPDYVFEADYPLMSLYELEARIQQQKHLPEIPSAGEIEKDGVLVGEMQSLLMKKIEELTLYTIAQQKELDQLRTEMDAWHSSGALKQKARTGKRASSR